MRLSEHMMSRVCMARVWLWLWHAAGKRSLGAGGDGWIVSRRVWMAQITSPPRHLVERALCSTLAKLVALKADLQLFALVWLKACCP